MTHVAIVGAATGREHCLVRELVRSHVHTVSAILWDPHEPIRFLASRYAVLDIVDTRATADLLASWRPDYVVVGHGRPLFGGLADRLAALGIPCIGPPSSMARIESSKSFGRSLVSALTPQIVPRYRSFDAVGTSLMEFAESLGTKVVLKCDGPVRNPRVRFFATDPRGRAALLQTAAAWVRRAGSVVVEEFVEGREFAVLYFLDGRNLLASPPFRNYKHVADGDSGELTSGMATLAGNALVTAPDVLAAALRLAGDVRDRLEAETGRPYVGCLYGEFKLTPDGSLRLLEFNCRFGNPCTISLCRLMTPGLPALLDAMAAGDVAGHHWEWSSDWALAAYVVPMGYTITKANVGKTVDFSACSPEKVFLGKLSFAAGRYGLLDSRALAICSRAASLPSVREELYGEMAKISGPVHYRRDLGLG